MNNYVTVGECLEPVPRQVKVKRSEYLSRGLIPVVDQGAEYIAGYVEDEAIAYKGSLPVVVFGDHTRCLKWVSFPFAIGADGTQLLRPDTRFDVRYFYYALVNLNLKNYGYERHFKYLKEEKLLLRPIEEQRRVASILSSYDDLIENNNRRIAILQEMARRIYEEWFVHFRFPGHETVRMVESELGPVPEGWVIREVKDIVVRLPLGRVYKEADVSVQGAIPVIDQSTSELLGFHNGEPAHEATAESPVVIFGDHTCKMQLMVTPFSLGPNTVPFVAESLPVHYVYSLIKGLIVTREYKRHWSDLMKKSVLVASTSTAEQFSNVVRPMAELTEKLRRKSRNLRAQRDLLLPKLISGEIDVSTLPEPEALAA